MIRIWMAAWLAWAGATGVGQAQAQTADLSAELISNPAAALVVGDEFVVTTTVRNNGPGAASPVLVQVGTPPAGAEGFYFDVAGVESGGCSVDSFDFEPPSFNYYWQVATLPSGSSASCAVLLRVRTVPSAGSVPLQMTVSSNTPDPVSANNGAAVTLGFQVASGEAVTIPAVGNYTLLLLAVVIALGGILLVNKGTNA